MGTNLGHHGELATYPEGTTHRMVDGVVDPVVAIEIEDPEYGYRTWTTMFESEASEWLKGREGVSDYEVLYRDPRAEEFEQEAEDTYCGYDCEGAPIGG